MNPKALDLWFAGRIENEADKLEKEKAKETFSGRFFEEAVQKGASNLRIYAESIRSKYGKKNIAR